jgi:hypothetical protein
LEQPVSKDFPGQLLQLHSLHHPRPLRSGYYYLHKKIVSQKEQKVAGQIKPKGSTQNMEVNLQQLASQHKTDWCEEVQLSSC